MAGGLIFRRWAIGFIMLDAVIKLVRLAEEMRAPYCT